MAATSPAAPPPGPEQGTLTPVSASAVPPGRPTRVTSAPITTAVPSTDFLAIIDPPARIDCCDPGCKPTPVNTQATAAVLAEQHDEWTEMRRYIGLEVLRQS